MADDDVKIKIDLDSKDAVKNVLELKDSMGSLNEVESVEGFLKNIMKFGPALGAAGLAIYAVKEAIQATFEAEKIKAVNQQFEVMTKNAGIATDTLKQGLLEAAKGLADDTDLMKAANKALVSMGSGAEKLPQLMDLARKSTAAFGGTLLDNFEAMSQAIASGNMKQLKNMGIMIDADKAVKDYAASIGVAANELSQAGRQQAIMNAVLEKGEQAFKGVNTDVLEGVNTFQQLMVTVNQVKEVILLAFEKTAGPAVRSFLHDVKDTAEQFKTFITAKFGEGAEGAAANIEQIKSNIKSMKDEMISLDMMGDDVSFIDKMFGKTKQDRIAELQLKIKEAEGSIREFQAVVDEEGEKGVASEAQRDAAKLANEQVNQQQRLQNQITFQAQIQQMKEQALQLEMQQATSIDQFDAIRQQQKLQLEEQYANQVAMIKEKMKGHDAQIKEALAQAQSIHNSKIAALEEDLGAKRKKIWDNYAKTGESAFDRLAAGAKATSAKMGEDMMDFSAMGSSAVNSLQRNATTAFTKLGEGTTDVAGAMKMAILGALGDEAIARGSVMLGSSIWPPNPVGLAGGAALIALGGMLKSQAGGAGGGSRVSAPAASSGSLKTEANKDIDDRYDLIAKRQEELKAKEYIDPMAGQTIETEKYAAPKKSVTIAVQGNYFETEETRGRLLSMMRESTDATDFKYQQIGQ